MNVLDQAERKRRRAETAAMTKCKCGNVARLGETRCGRCQEREDRKREELAEQERQDRRNAFIDSQMQAG